MIESGDIQVIIEDGNNANLTQQIAYIKAGKTEIEEAVQEGIGDFDTNATAKTNAFNDNASAKTLSFNQNADAKTAIYDNNASEKLSAYNENATNKLAAYNANDTAKTEAYNLNATNKTTAFNTNASEKTSTFNDNAVAKTSGFNSNATSKTNDFNSNASDKTTAFNDNYTAKKALIDADVQTAKDWATKTDGKVDGVDYSAKYYAQSILPIKDDITAVAEIATDVSDVADIKDEVTAVANDKANIDTVANDITNVNTVAGDHANIQTVVNNMTAINNAPTYANNSKIWAEGTDGEVAPLGGTHSSKVWAKIAEDAASGVQNPANRDLSNLTNTGQMIIDSQNGTISNCILEIPQDIKLELNNGTLTLKSGSKCYKPDGTYLTTVRDLSFNGTTYGTAKYMVFRLATASAFSFVLLSNCVSGTTAPSASGYYAWFDTANNEIKIYNNGSDLGTLLCMPLCIVDYTNGTGVTSIDQVFNGFGYIGSTVFALPGVKGLVPNGRNADGTLKSTLISYTVVKVATATGNNIGNRSILFDNGGIVFAGNEWYYDEQSNYVTNGTTNVNCFIGGSIYLTNDKISNWNPKTAFHALEYNDSSTISGWSMPSSRYIDLTLGASGATYTAPANGYFCLDKAGTQNEYIDIRNNTTGLLRSKTTISAPGRESIAVYMPCKKGDEIAVVYTATGTTSRFRFIYAEGENV